MSFLFVTGCGSEGTVAVPRAVSVEIGSDTVWAPPGAPVTVQAIAKDSAGNVVTNAVVTWTMSDPSVATVRVPAAASGNPVPLSVQVTGVRDGSATKLIAALSSGASSTATVVVARAALVYDVATTLTTYRSEGGPCPQFVMYCTVDRPTSEATLSGAITVAFDGVFGSFLGCTPNYPLFPSCASVRLYIFSTFSSGTRPANRLAWDSLSAWDFMLIGVPGDYGPVVRLVGPVTGDSTSGEVEWWSVRAARNPPKYLGTFVARRRK